MVVMSFKSPQINMIKHLCDSAITVIFPNKAHYTAASEK